MNLAIVLTSTEVVRIKICPLIQNVLVLSLKGSFLYNIFELMKIMGGLSITVRCLGLLESISQNLAKWHISASKGLFVAKIFSPLCSVG